jgi:membrane glycosyltransferase
LYGDIFRAGVSIWAGSQSNYWGHNAMNRTRAFPAEARLHQLRRRKQFGGHILSHDFDEAALLRRAGYEVWLEPRLGGSYEEAPPSLVDELTRDRRWVRGNLQHLAFLFRPGFAAAHRAAFLNGIMSYFSSVLWFAFLVAVTVETALLTLLPVTYFPEPYALHPLWPEWRPDWALMLVGVTATVLFSPKVLAFLDAVSDRQRRRAMGGAGRLALSLLIETLVSSLLAPIRMLAHSQFVTEALLNTQVLWAGQNRTRETAWSEALVRQAPGCVLALAWVGFAYWLDPRFFVWSLPVAVPLVFAAPISVWLSRYRAGARLRAAGLLLAPEESTPPPELEDLTSWRCPVTGGSLSGFARAVLSPVANALHRQLARPRGDTPLRRRLRERLMAACARGGPGALATGDKRFLAEDARALADLHQAAWEQPPDSPWGVLIERLLQEPVPPHPAPAVGSPQAAAGPPETRHAGADRGRAS